MHLASGSPTSPASALAFLVTPAWLTGTALWLNIGAVGLLIFGVVLTLRKNEPPPTGADRVIRFGPAFFTISLAFFGMQHFALFNSVKPAVPAWMPWPSFWTYFVGAALIAACVSILTGVKAELAALLLGIMFVLFVLMLHLPNLVQNPHDRFALSPLLRDLALSGGAFALAATISAAAGRPRRWLAETGRYFFAVPILYFGVEHFLHPEFAPGVPLEMLMPSWIPGHVVWAWITGAVLLAGGACIVLNQAARRAATVVAAAYLLLVVCIYLPMELAHPSTEISGELDYVADTLAMGGAALLIAGSLPRAGHRSAPPLDPAEP
jgi:uncharacterized membrane protein